MKANTGSGTASFNGQVFAVMKDGTATAVIIHDTDDHKGDDRTPLRQDIRIISTNTGNNIVAANSAVLYTIEDSNAATPSLSDLQDALTAALAKENYSDFSWTGNTLSYTKPNGTTGSVSGINTTAFTWVYKMTLKNQGSEEYYYVRKGTAAFSNTGSIYSVSDANEANAVTAGLNMTVAKYNQDSKGAANGTGVVTDVTTSGTFAYYVYDADLRPLATHDFTVETGYVNVGPAISDSTVTGVSYERKIGERVLTPSATEYAKVGDTIKLTVNFGTNNTNVDADDTIDWGTAASYDLSGLTMVSGDAVAAGNPSVAGVLTVTDNTTALTGKLVVTYTVGVTDFTQAVAITAGP